MRICTLSGVLASFALLALAGCATAPAAGSQFDGSYAGVSTRTRGNAELCGPASAPDTIDVSAGVFSYPVTIVWNTSVVVRTQLHADGSFDGAVQYFDSSGTSSFFGGHYAWVTVIGRIADGTLDAKVEDRACGRHLALRRS